MISTQTLSLVEENTGGMTFKYYSAHSALLAGIAGVGSASGAGLLYFFDKTQIGPWAGFGGLGALFIYLSIYNLLYTQWLTINFRDNTIRFYKKSLYSFVEWVRLPQDFKSLTVCKNIHANRGWRTFLMCKDGTCLEIMEDVFFVNNTKSQALNFVGKISRKTGIKIEENC